VWRVTCLVVSGIVGSCLEFSSRLWLLILSFFGCPVFLEICDLF